MIVRKWGKDALNAEAFDVKSGGRKGRPNIMAKVEAASMVADARSRKGLKAAVSGIKGIKVGLSPAEIPRSTIDCDEIIRTSFDRSLFFPVSFSVSLFYEVRFRPWFGNRVEIRGYDEWNTRAATL